MKELIRKHVEEVNNQITELGSMELGSEAYVETVRGISALTKDITDLEKIDLEQERIRNEHEENMNRIENERKAKEKEMKDQKAKNWLTALGIAVPMGGAIWGTIYTWAKEQEGINASEAGRKATAGLFKIFNRK